MPLKTNSGDRQTRVELHRPKPTAEADDYNEVDLTDAASWEWVADRWVQVKNSNVGREQIIADQTLATSSFLVRIPWDPDLAINETWRMRPKGSTRNWNIVAVVNWEERNEWWHVTCIEAK